jgi:hypothetical protein
MPLDREGDLALDLPGERGGDRVDLDLHRGRVREGVDVRMWRRPETSKCQRNGDDQRDA